MANRATAYLLTGLALVAGASGAAISQGSPSGEPTLRVNASTPVPRPPAVRRVIIRNQLILKVPLQPRQSSRVPLVELDAPRCLATRAIRGARLSGPRSIDFLLSRERKLRVHMDDDCKSLDFYGGFYLQPEDERLCPGRDVIRTRMGGNCRIERFQLLQTVDAYRRAAE